jgi:hypothetical protein
MPCDYSRYPDNWRTISDRIRFERAGGKCEQCGAPHDALIIRSIDDPARYVIYDAETDYYRWPDGTALHDYLPEEYDAAEKFTRVILTVHHIGVEKPDGTPGDMHDKMDCRDENLIALCQRCHLLADLDEHIRKAQITRLQKRDEAIAETGQLRLFE